MANNPTVARWTAVAPPKPRPASGTYVTAMQAAAFRSYMQTHSESETARQLGLSQIRTRELLVQYERNLLRDAGLSPPSLKEMLKGDISTRFQISRDLRNGRPASHARAVAMPVPAVPATGEAADGWRHVEPPSSGVRRFVVTSARADATVHGGFMRNLEAYAGHHGAELVVAALGPRSGAERGLVREPIDFAGRLDLRADIMPPMVSRMPLEGLQHLSPGRWAAFPHASQQLESLPRIGRLPPRVHLTTGAATAHGDPARRTPARLGALVVEMLPDGRVLARTISTSASGDGSFHDLDERVSKGRVATGLRVAGLVAGDLHHPRCDPTVVTATWGSNDGDDGLVARLRPHAQVLHDVCDMRARSHHERRDAHARFAHHVRGTGDVRAELASTAAFLERIRLADGVTAVVHSNHDEHLLRWLREADHRSDLLNAEFQLDRERALLARIRSGADTDTFFAETLRSLSKDGLDGVRFLSDGDTFPIGGVECGVHGHAGPDGTRGSVGAFERLGIDMVLGHFHRPLARGGLHVSGVCQLDLGYARGPSSWAIAHVVVHHDGSRQHVFLDGDRFAA
ncbi:hypothetical protein GGQ80_002987 [Sphingomonas jinjuensis]|uniref:Uncharacterized protein n=1 Tax=Sphingomonas jinjuensis TaxID=535907 RepID=A0A840FAL8_9SPHN|nr:hypothetical protein [Sphingomonas jinjuensis]MBB4155070.1 hypothetical protein [Sphingomonas jinjuensis]